MTRKVATSRKSKTQNRQWKTRPITVWVCDCDLQDALFILIFLHFEFL